MKRTLSILLALVLIPALPVALASYFTPAPVVLVDDEESECEVDGWLHYLSELGIPDIGEEAAK
jgi:hypothetical protein